MKRIAASKKFKRAQRKMSEEVILYRQFILRKKLLQGLFFRNNHHIFMNDAMFMRAWQAKKENSP